MEKIIKDTDSANYWLVPDNLDTTDFDFNWRPDPYDPPYIHQFGTQWQKTGGPRYVVDGATDYKYHDSQRATKLPEPHRFKVLTDFHLEFDWSWHPDETEPDFLWTFGCQFTGAESLPVIEYAVNGSTTRKFLDNPVAKLTIKQEDWIKNYDVVDFDWTWHPHPLDPRYIYAWGNKWIPAEIKSTLEYRAPGATQYKYMRELVPLKPNMDRWTINAVVKNFDFSWVPPVWDEPYIYAWGNKWVAAALKSTLEYRVPGATQYKYMDQLVDVEPENDRWTVHSEVTNFDFTWRPDPTEPPFIYAWGSKWVAAQIQPTVEYKVPGATEYKYMDEVVQLLECSAEDSVFWTVNNFTDYGNFDFTWKPNPLSTPQIYQWINGGPIYTVPGATSAILMTELANQIKSVVKKYYIKTTLEDLIEEHSEEVFWALNPDLDYTKFDFSWQPSQENFLHINVFGNKVSIDTKTYYVNGPMWKLGYKEYNYIDNVEVKIDSNLQMFWIDTGNYCDYGYLDLKKRYPDIVKTRFANSWIETVGRCVKKSSTKFCWILSSELDYREFNFDFYPSKWQTEMLHVFGHQWGEWSNTYLINCSTFEEDTKWLDDIHHVKNINLVRDKRAKITKCKWNILHINYGPTQSNIVGLPAGNTVYHTTYKDSYLDTIRNWCNNNREKINNNTYMWITTSISDYSKFDFTWSTDPFSADQLHVFASSRGPLTQKFGDTFFLNLGKFGVSSQDLDALENYDGKVNYIEYLNVPRLDHPVLTHDFSSVVDAIPLIRYSTFPYAELVNLDVCEPVTNIIPPNLWVAENTPVTAYNRSGSQVVVPGVAAKAISGEVYDYPWIERYPDYGSSRPLDIIFISNGEPVAHQNYLHLQRSLEERGVKNRLVWVKDVAGRVASQHAAATSSNTDWYFLVNGKVRVSGTFDWGWQPDRLQAQKHYIFNVLNPVNGLRYGHQAIVANNKQLTLSTVVSGLDFTLDSLHAVADMDCGVAVYNTDPWTTWRTAFRESIKLRSNIDTTSAERLQTWLSDGTGDNAVWSQRGARDGVEYWNSVSGDPSKLMLSYDWEWIQTYYNTKYK